MTASARTGRANLAAALLRYTGTLAVADVCCAQIALAVRDPTNILNTGKSVREHAR